MKIISPGYYIDYIYGPRDIDQNFYDKIIESYVDIVRATRSTPRYEEIEEWVLREAIDEVIDMNYETYHYDPEWNLGLSAEMNDASVRALVKSFAMKEDIEKCLKHAKLAYISQDYEMPLGYIEVMRNSPQLSLIEI